MSESDPARQRLDIWLYRARFFKTRSLATKIISKGKVRIRRNGVTERTTKPHFMVRPGDTLTFMSGKTLLQIEMVGIAHRRGPASEAATLYNHTENS